MDLEFILCCLGMVAFLVGLIVLFGWLEKKGIISATPEKPRRSSSSSSSSSSRSSSSSSDSVRVKVTFKTNVSSIWLSLHNIRETQQVTIPKVEYKSLLNGSMKARIAWVYAKFSIPSSIKVSDVSIISLD